MAGTPAASVRDAGWTERAAGIAEAATVAQGCRGRRRGPNLGPEALTMPERDFVKTGIAGLDDIMAGGLLRGSVVLVEGTAGTGKTTLGMEFIYRGAAEFNEPGLIVLFEEGFACAEPGAARASGEQREEPHGPLRERLQSAIQLL